MKNMTVIIALSIFLIFSVACEKENPDEGNASGIAIPDGKSNSFSGLTNDLDALTHRLLDGNTVNIKNAVIKVAIPSRDYEWNKGWGYAHGSTPVSSQDQFYSASIGKMTLATLAMIYLESGHLKLDDPIRKYLDEASLKGLFLVDGTDYSSSVTIKHLLSHTSGLQNYFTDGDQDYNANPDFQELMMKDSKKIWQATEILDWIRNKLPALSAPGSQYHYSDTGYVLMGMVLEAVSGQKLHQMYRERLWKPLGMDQTYMWFKEKPVAPVSGTQIAHTYADSYDMSTINALSADWAGGGLITSTLDLYKFINAWVNNRIFKKDGTKALMEDYHPTEAYGLGHWKIKPSGWKETIIGHDGTSQSFCFYVPRFEAYIIGTFNQTSLNTTMNHYSFIEESIKLLDQHLK